MIVPVRVVPPLALLVALVTLTVAFDAGIAEAPNAFFGSRDDVVLIHPPGAEITSSATVPTKLATLLSARDDVAAASAEIILPTAIEGRSAIVRGARIPDLLALEEARLVEGRLPSGATEALAGVGFARGMDADVGDAFVVPGSIRQAAARVTIVGLFDTQSAVRDEIVVDLALARGLAGVADGRAHFIRVKTEAPDTIRSLTGALLPEFTYGKLDIATRAVVPGEPVLVRVNVTNWAFVDGTQDVVVRVDGVPSGSLALFVPALSTVAAEIPVTITTLGRVNVSVNPSDEIDVVPPDATFIDVPAFFVEGRPATVRVLGPGAVPVAAATVTFAGDTSVTDAEGRATLTPQDAGRSTIVARRDGRGLAALAAPVVRAALAETAAVEAIALEGLPAFAREGAKLELGVRFANHGGVAGDASADVLLDGAPIAQARASVGPASGSVVPIALPPLALGDHSIQVGPLKTTLRIVDEDPQIAALLAARSAAREEAVGASLDAGSYISRIVDGARAAAMLLAIFAGLLAVLASVAVWSRHLSERADAIGVLKALGASRDQAHAVLLKEAALAASLATAIGIAAGWLVALALDATGTVRAFGHQVHPTLGPWLVAAIASASVLLQVLIARGIGRGLYARPAESLLRRHVLEPPPRDAPTLADAITRGRT